jgi:ATP-dependent DNA helicase RecG
MPQAGLLGLINYPNGQTERREFNEPAVMIPDLVEKWLKDKLPNVFERDHTDRRERPALPFEMVREAVGNALIHRDYAIGGAKCQLIVTEDAVTVMSPGEPPPPVTLAQLQAFTAPMLSRNPELHFAFARMEMAEEQGLGIRSLRDRAMKLALPLPKFVWEPPYLVLTLYRNPEAATKTLGGKVLKSMSKSERAGWVWLATRESVTTAEYQEAMGLPNRTAKNHLKKFTELGLLFMTGAGRATRYEVVRK